MTAIRIPRQLYDAVHEDDRAERFAWLAALPDTGMAHLLDVDALRVTQWLFARCVQESLHDLSMRKAALRLSSRIT